MEQKGLTGAAGYHHVLATPHQSRNELGRSDSFRF
jgi:hypothetical protein